MSKIKLALSRAEMLCAKIKQELEPGCHRIEIAGSIRRKKPVIGDLEIVCIPIRQTDLFGEETSGPSLLDGILDQLVEDGRLRPGNLNGPKFKQFEIPSIDGLHLDLFITTFESWGNIFAIRTGSASFTKKLVTQKYKGGLLDNEYHVAGGRVWKDKEPVAMPTERDFLALAGGWIEPEMRV